MPPTVLDNGQWKKNIRFVRTGGHAVRLPCLVYSFRGREFSLNTSPPCYRATQHSTAPTHVSIILPPSTDCHETIRRYVFNESRSIVRDCSVRLACGPNVGEEAHLPRSPSRGETYERKMGATRSVKRERERPYSYDACHGRERVSAREC